MADLFSIIASTAGILDNCVQFGAYLRDAKQAANIIQQDLTALLDEFAALQAVNNSIRDTWLDHQKNDDPESSAVDPLLQPPLEALGHALGGCNESMQRLGKVIEEVVGTEGHVVKGKLDGIKKVLRKQSKKEAILEASSRS